MNVLQKYDPGSDYAPGHEPNGEFIFLADWNKVPEKFRDWLEREQDIEWSDEWVEYRIWEEKEED